MTDDMTQQDSTEPESTEPASGSGKKDPTGVEGANPALDDTGKLKAAETGEAPEAPENLEDLDLTPAGLANEPAKEEETDSPVEPENS
jgi:hypothetical protein